MARDVVRSAHLLQRSRARTRTCHQACSVRLANHTTRQSIPAGACHKACRPTPPRTRTCRRCTARACRTRRRTQGPNTPDPTTPTGTCRRRPRSHHGPSSRVGRRRCGSRVTPSLGRSGRRYSRIARAASSRWDMQAGCMRCLSTGSRTDIRLCGTRRDYCSPPGRAWCRMLCRRSH